MKAITFLLLIIHVTVFGQVTLDPSVQYDIQNTTRLVLQEIGNYNSTGYVDYGMMYGNLSEDELCQVISKSFNINLFKVKELYKAEKYDIPKTGNYADWVQYKVGDVVFSFHTFYGTLNYWDFNKGKWKKIQRQQTGNYWKPFTQYRVLYSDDPSIFKYYEYSTQTIHIINTSL